MNVLDHGKIELVATHGNDKMVVNAARVSFANADWFAEVDTLKDTNLIDYLAKNKHVSPFYHPHVSLVVRAPISVQRQSFKHKIGTAENSESTRYTEVAKEFYLPEQFRQQSENNKQGSDGVFSEEMNAHLQIERVQFYNRAWEEYDYELRCGVARELARDVLPMATYTSWFWTLSLAAVAHFIRLRDEEHAQEEIRCYAKAMRSLVEPKFPKALSALLSYP